MLMSISEETTALIFLDLELEHHFINRKLVIQSQHIFQANPTPAYFILLLLVNYYYYSKVKVSHVATDGLLVSMS
jgi:hypothetical protein